jgi:molybdopterin-binding protein
MKGTQTVMKISARNTMKGTVKSLVSGMVTAEVVIEVAPGLEVAAVITQSSAENLGLKVGDEAYAVVQASDVMVAMD